MSVEDYKVENDNFKFDIEEYDYAFPCCVCVHVTKLCSDEPCNTCGHNLTAEKPENLEWNAGRS